MRHWLITTVMAITLALLNAAPGIARDYRPVIFVPGLMGSTLVNKDGQQVWGGYGDVLGRFEQLAFPADPAKDTIRANGVLEQFDIAFGFFNVKAYGPMTDFLKRKVGNQLNVFAYDWRQSNFASACDLVRYIDKRKNLADAASGEGGITLVTHSMGGIVGRLFISYRAPAGTAATETNPCPHQYNVTLFMPIAAPFNGAGHALKTLTDDVGFKWKVIRLSKETILGVFFTVPSVYELLPRYANCCREKVQGRVRAVDLFDVENWKKFGWIPAKLWNYPKAARLPFLENRLKVNARLREIIATPLPAETKFISLWGYNQSTSTVVTVRNQGQEKARQEWAESSAGDDTVPELSASVCLPSEAPDADGKPCIAIPDLTPTERRMWKFPNTHLGLMADDRVQKTVMWAINRYGSQVAGARSLEDDEIPDDIAPFLMSSERSRTLDDAGLAKATFVNVPESVKAGQDYTVLFSVTDRSGGALPLAAAGTVSATVRTAGGTIVPATVSLTSLPGHFGVAFRAPKGPDALTIEVRLPPTDGVEPRADTLVVVEE